VARADDPALEAAGRFLNSFKRPAHLLVAISGGSDSTGLLVALAMLCATGRFPDITLSACTIDHDLRPGSAEEAVWVGALCARHGVAHSIRRWEGGKPVSGLQAAARSKRYELAAHTRDDQSETVAMRAARSAEGIGLSGMADGVLLNGAVWLMRPFLGIDRAAIRALLAARDESWLEDPSNDNPRFERVRLRTRGVSPGEGGRDRALLSRQAAAFLAENVRVEAGAFGLEPAAIGRLLLDAGSWRGLLVLAATAGGRVHALEAASAERLRNFLASGTLSRLTAGRVVFDRRRDGLFLYREARGIEPLLLLPGAAAVWDGRYHLVNCAGRAITVSAGGGCGGHGGDSGLSGPALRASRAAPCLKFEDGEHVSADLAIMEPLITPYARFLPRFDLSLANALAGIFGCPTFPSPPNE
jgi:tRNA(Ile)-lysidine synthase